MFFNLTPYLTWLGIMLTSKPNDLQNRLNILSQPATTSTLPPSTTPPTTSTTAEMTTDIWDFFICSGRPFGRYPHSKDCTKYFVCGRDAQIVRPNVCPNDLYFSPVVLLCTLPQDSGCVVTSTTLSEDGSTGPTSIPGVTTLPPSGSSWLRQVEAANYYKPVNEDRLVIYFDHEVASPQNILWPISFTRNMWESVIMMYGSFGTQNRLYVVFRGGPLTDDHNYSSYLDNSRGYVNAIEVGSSDWSIENSTNMDLITRNLAEIVSKNARGIHYPGSQPNWSDIFVYDLYERIGRVNDSARWETQVREESESNIASIPLFSQWYLHIYRTYGGGSVLNRFFILREQLFPKAAGDNSTFARTMNRGEFVHFWSGTTGANLTGLASSVFGWSDSLSGMYQKAMADFSSLNY